MPQGNVIEGIGVTSYGTVYKLTNISGKRLSGTQYGLPIMEPGDSVDIPENKLKPAHGGLVQEGLMSSVPALPPDLVQLARSILWQDVAWQRMRDEEVQTATQLLFNLGYLDPVHPGPYPVGTPQELELEVKDAAGILVTSHSEEEVDVTLSSGVIAEVEGGHLVSGSLNTAGPVRVAFSSGNVKIKVVESAPAVMNVTLANSKSGLALPAPASLTWV